MVDSSDGVVGLVVLVTRDGKDAIVTLDGTVLVAKGAPEARAGDSEEAPEAKRADGRTPGVTRAAASRKTLWVWTEAWCAMEMARIIMPLISVNSLHKEGRICLEEFS
jgi:hypothetical protein